MGFGFCFITISAEADSQDAEVKKLCVRIRLVACGYFGGVMATPLEAYVSSLMETQSWQRSLEVAELYHPVGVTIHCRALAILLVNWVGNWLDIEWTVQ